MRFQLWKEFTKKRYYRKYFKDNRLEIGKLYRLLEDDVSMIVVKNILNAYTSFLHTPEYYLKKASSADCTEYHFVTDNGYIVKGVKNPYFLKELFRFRQNIVILDGGGYIGDTVELAFNELNDNIEMIYSFEPNEDSFCQEKKNTSKYGSHVICYNAALSDHEGVDFFNKNDAGSRLDEKGEYCVNVIDVAAFLNSAEYKVNFIKLDIEGYEKKVIYAMEDYIKENKPDLAVSIYHSLDDIWNIPNMLSEICHEYKIYIRHQSNYYTETICYATI